METATPPSQIFRITRLCLMMLGCVCLGVGGGYMLKFAAAHGTGKHTAMAIVTMVVATIGLIFTVVEILRKQK